MKWLQCIQISLFLIFSISARAQDTEIIESFQSFHKSNILEKVYLHTDKEVYAAGESIWFAVYLVNGSTHLPSTLSELAYVELLDSADQVLSQIPLKIVEGVADGDITLGDSLQAGKYTMRGFTHYQRNFDPAFIFSKSIFLVATKPDSTNAQQVVSESSYDLQVFPEGGDLVADMVNHVAFKAVDENGNGAEVEGELLGEDGAVITTFKSQHAGHGKFLFTPAKWKPYQLKYKIEGKDFKMDMPAVKEAGCILSVRQTSSAMHVTGSVSEGIAVEESFILGHVRGQIFVLAKPQPGKSSIYAMIPHEKLPNGVIHFTMFHKGLPIQERLAYNENTSIFPRISFFPENLGTRKRIKMEFELLDFQEEYINGKMSISILGESVRENQTSIASYLNLFSDLKGKVEEPSYYFNAENKSRLKHLDLLMMTQGWRRFVWGDVMGKRLPPINFFAEKGFTIEGKVVKYYNRDKPEPSSVSLNFVENLLFKEETTTDEDGNFWFDGLQIQDTVNVMLQALKEGKGKKAEESKRDKSTFIEIKKAAALSNSTTLITTLEGESKKNYTDIVTEIDETTYSKDAIKLDDFTVTARRLDDSNQPFKRPGMLYKDPSSRVVTDSILGYSNYTNLFDAMKGQVPGVSIEGLGNEKTARIRGVEVTFLYDGLRVDAAFINQLDPRQVEFMDVIKGISASAIYGSRGASVIAIYSRQNFTPDQDVDPKGMTFFTHNGYYQAREFYTPNYEEMTPEEALDRDIRSTQYWSSIVDIEEGEASIEYFSSDNLGTFYVYLEGITDKGQPFAEKFTIDIEK